MSPQRSATLQKILESLPISVVVSSFTDGAILWVNARDLELAGATRPQQIVGHNLLEFIEPSQHAVALRDVEAVARGESPPPVIYKLRRLDGGSADVQIASIPVLYQGEQAMLSLCADVTDSQRASRALAESEERYRGLVEHSPDGVVVVAEGGELDYVNPTVVRALCAPDADALLGRSFYDFVVPEHRKPVRDARRRVLSSGDAHPAAPVTLLGIDGRRVETTARTSVIRWQGEIATQTVLRDLEPDPECAIEE